jgi:integrase
MSIHQNFTQGKNNIEYLPAVLHELKCGWRIEYYALNPAENTLKRVRVKVKRLTERYRTKKEAREHCQNIINTINAKLAGGWSPFYSIEDSRLYVKLSEVAKLFIAEKTKELRAGTMRSYSSVVKMLIEWTTKNLPDIYCSMFGKIHAIRYLEYMYNEKNVSARTYNNNIKQLRVFFNWAKEKLYCKENVFEFVKLKAAQKKNRIIVPPNVRQNIIKHLEKNNPNYLIVCELVYFSLIRPNEIKNLKVKDINFEEKFITVSGDFAKNHKTRYSALNNDLVERLRVMVRDVPKDYYIFGWNCSPSKRKIADAYFSKQFIKMRKTLKLPDEMQLYSFRDTGIFEMLKSGVDDLTVMQHADHSSLNITTVYANHADPQLIERVREAKVSF